MLASRSVPLIVAALALAACRAPASPSTHDEGSAAATEAPAAQEGAAESPSPEATPPAAAFDPATQLPGLWSFDEARTRAGLSVEVAGQFPVGLTYTMTFGDPEETGEGSGDGSGTFSMLWSIPGEERGEPTPGRWHITHITPETRTARVSAWFVLEDSPEPRTDLDADITFAEDGTMHFVDRSRPGLVMILKRISVPEP